MDGESQVTYGDGRIMARLRWKVTENAKGELQREVSGEILGPLHSALYDRIKFASGSGADEDFHRARDIGDALVNEAVDLANAASALMRESK